MKKIVKRTLLAAVILFVAIQFFRPEPNRATEPQQGDIAVHYAIPVQVRQLLQRSCYDCHSNTTYYPWYSKVQPVAWWLDNHIKEGKRELNFSEFAAYAPKKAAHKLDEVAGEIAEHEMPLSSYLWMHPKAKLSDEEIALIRQWTIATADSIRKANGLPIQP
jgi:uncharacterized membrane protein